MEIANSQERAESLGASATADWPELVRKIVAGDAAGMEELYRIFSRGVRFYLWRHLGPQDLDDILHDIFLIVAQAIQRGELREPERLMGFVRTVLRRQIALRIDQAVHNRNRRTDLDPGLQVLDSADDPEYAAIRRQRQELALRVLSGVSPRDREILIRFYLHEQNPMQICQEMGITQTQFRLLKSRAKARFGELGRRALEPKKPWQFS